jgi:tetratricopeptide (TPR) repeat protein
MATESGNKRRRGVIACRAKLAHAMGGAGLKTQAALADRIADLEGLDSSPRDAVSRAFRELPVDVHTLERIASALGVEARSLYQSADKIGQPADEQEDRRISRHHIGSIAMLATIAVLVAIAATIWRLQSDNPGTPKPTLVLDLGSPTLVIVPFRQDEENRIGNLLLKKLSDTFSVASNTSLVLTQSLEPSAVAEKLRADIVVDGEIVTIGRLVGVRAYALANGVRQQVWAESMPLVALDENRDEIAGHIAVAVKRAVGFPVPDDTPSYFPLAPVQDDYLEGTLHLDRPSNELNIKRAQSRFEAALRQDANYARAHAGLCQTLLDEYWMSDEQRALDDASRACGQALQLNPADPLVSSAHALFLRRTGRNDEATALYESLVRKFPRYASVRAGLAASYLDTYRKYGDKEILSLAKQAARDAADMDPYTWKPLFALSTMEWFDGNVAGAIAASEDALARDRNEYVAANLGTFYLCDGVFQKAINSYTLAQELAPGSYVGDEFLGLAHYFLGNFEESLRLRKRAIEAISTGEPELHEMWGNLGDSYRQLDATADAVAAYLKAAEIAERDHLRGTAPAADRVARAYYYTTLRRLDPTLVSAAVEESIARELDEIDAGIVASSAHRRMAEIRLMRGEYEKARSSLERASQTCKGYGMLPDLAPVNQVPDAS